MVTWISVHKYEGPMQPGAQDLCSPDLGHYIIHYTLCYYLLYYNNLYYVKSSKHRTRPSN
jgi:hypothetical protein